MEHLPSSAHPCQPPEGFEFAEQTRKVQPGEWYLTDSDNPVPIQAGFSGTLLPFGPRRILNKLPEAPEFKQGDRVITSSLATGIVVEELNSSSRLLVYVNPDGHRNGGYLSWYYPKDLK